MIFVSRSQHSRQAAVYAAAFFFLVQALACAEDKPFTPVGNGASLTPKQQQSDEAIEKIIRKQLGEDIDAQAAGLFLARARRAGAAQGTARARPAHRAGHRVGWSAADARRHRDDSPPARPARSVRGLAALASVRDGCQSIDAAVRAR